jgi:hypothetical protein
VFNSPFRDLFVTSDDPEEAMIDKNYAAKTFLAIFRTTFLSDIELAKEHKFLKHLRLKLSTFIMIYRDQELIPIHEFQSMAMFNVLDFFQNYLMLDIKMFYSIDKDQIYCKVRASEENLKAHADLTDYKLQFVHHPEETKYFEKIPPFAPFEHN